MNILIVGANGQLGKQIRHNLVSETEWRILEVSRKAKIVDGETSEFTSSSRTDWLELFHDEHTHPEFVVNTAAMTNVDRCETEREQAWRDNTTLVGNLVEGCRRTGSRLIQISTDNIFDGAKGPYDETAAPNPINYYGKTKLAAENDIQRHGIIHTILRTMWLYGGTERRQTFIDWATNALANGDHINVAADELGNPTIYNDVAYAVRRIIEKGITGVYNIAGPDILSRLEVAQMIADRIGAPPELIKPVNSKELGRAALRPLNSGLVTLKSQTELGIRPTPLLQGIETVTAQRIRQQHNSRTMLR
jgi:dTDP-4-dehydrorhamnose reductase